MQNTAQNAKETTDVPKLAPPGAGLPWIELQIARLGFKWLSRNSTKKSSSGLIEKQRVTLVELAGQHDAISGMQRIPITRLRGMEDSSRFWSAFMTLDHLRIVNMAIVETVGQLLQGKSPAGVANTAQVKPDPAATVAVIQEFDNSCRLLHRCVKGVKDLNTVQFYAHPWFGKLDAAQWYFLAGFHMQLHQRQLELICNSLNSQRELLNQRDQN